MDKREKWFAPQKYNRWSKNHNQMRRNIYIKKPTTILASHITNRVCSRGKDPVPWEPVDSSYLAKSNPGSRAATAGGFFFFLNEQEVTNGNWGANQKMSPQHLPAGRLSREDGLTVDDRTTSSPPRQTLNIKARQKTRWRALTSVVHSAEQTSWCSFASATRQRFGNLPPGPVRDSGGGVQVDLIPAPGICSFL